MAKETNEQQINAEIRRLNAETAKLEVESEILRKQLNKRWYEAQLSQYIIATLVAGAFIFAWVLAYLTPLYKKRLELAEIKEQCNKSTNELIECENKKIKIDNRQLEIERAELTEYKKRLEDRSDRLQMLNADLEKRYSDLLDGHQLTKAEKEEYSRKVDQLRAEAESFKDLGRFSILQREDPIYQLEKYQWDVKHGDMYGVYFLKISNKNVFSGKPIMVSRVYDHDFLMKRDGGKRIQEISERMPVIFLDYNYYKLYKSIYEEVGGNLYVNKKKVRFYAELSQWDKKLKEILKDVE